MTFWQRWVRQPQTTWLRKAIFQVHLWSGIGIGLYVLMVSVTGSILVYRNELLRAAVRHPIIATPSGVPIGITLVTRLLELHDDLLGGSTGRTINGIGALLVIV